VRLAVGVRVTDPVVVGVAVPVAAAVPVAVRDDVAVRVRVVVRVGVPVRLGLGPSVTVCVAEAVRLAVGVWVIVAVGVRVGVLFAVAVGLAVMVTVAVAVGVSVSVCAAAGTTHKQAMPRAQTMAAAARRLSRRMYRITPLMRARPRTLQGEGRFDYQRYCMGCCTFAAASLGDERCDAWSRAAFRPRLLARANDG
jgi:hypothetical protein